MSTFGHAVLGDSGVSGSVAVAAAALVVVLTIVVVFVMVLRSNGSASKTAAGLGFDAQQGPLGQPQNDPNAWGRPASQSPNQPIWGAQPRAGAADAWGAAADMAPGAGQMGAMAPASNGRGGWPVAGPAAPADWDAPAAQGDAAPWGSPQRASGAGWGAQDPTSRPSAPGWGESPAGTPAASGRPAWGAPAAEPAPWDAAAASAPAWGSTPAAAPDGWAGAAGGQPAWAADQPPAGWGADQSPAGTPPLWGAPAAPSTPRQSVPAPAPAGFGANGFDPSTYADDRTRVSRPMGPQRMGMIIVRQGKEPGRTFELRKDRITIGRSRDSDIFLEDLAVSRLHTTVARDEGGRYIIRDENSANGTYVNNQRITEQPLEEGDEIQVGQSVLAFSLG